jgi:hypothetical protein
MYRPLHVVFSTILRCEQWNVDASANRASNWQKRLQLFGEERSFLPLNITGHGALLIQLMLNYSSNVSSLSLLKTPWVNRLSFLVTKQEPQDNLPATPKQCE